MPIDHTDPTALSIRLTRLITDAHRVADQLLALDLKADQIDLYLSAPAGVADMLLRDLANHMYCARHLDRTDWAEYYAARRALAQEADAGPEIRSTARVPPEQAGSSGRRQGVVR